MDYRRARMRGASWFFTVVTGQRRPLLVEHIDHLREAFRRVRRKHPFRIDAIVILPDHLHTIWTLPDDSDYSSRWMAIKRYFSSPFSALPTTPSMAAKREKGVWQRRYWEHRIRDERDWRNHLDYIHFNPVRHGYVQRVGDWPHSSFHRLVEQGWYEEDWGGEINDAVYAMDHE